jgi:hypothetical protein
LFFKGDAQPINPLIRDNKTLTSFSKAMEIYEKKKIQIKKDEENADKELKNSFNVIIRNYVEEELEKERNRKQ